MKIKITYNYILFFVAIVLFSCKKDYTCTCTTNITGFISSSYSNVYNQSDITKKDAENWCSNYEQTQATFGLSANTSCELSGS